MRKQKTVLLLIILNIFSLCLVAEEEGHRIRNMGIKTVGTYTGFVLGTMGGLFAGNTISQENDTGTIFGAKMVVMTVIGATCGTIAGKNVANKYIEYYYPKNPEEKADKVIIPKIIHRIR